MPRPRSPVILLGVALALPLAIALALPYIPAGRVVAPAPSAVRTSFTASTLPLTRSTLGRAPAGKPLITNVQIVDLDRDGLPDVLVCDAVLNRVVWYRQAPRGVWEERVLGDVDLPAPCHVCVADLNGDGHPDLAVAVLGSVYPTDDPVGKVVWLENDGRQNFTTHVVLDDLRRVADVQVGDLNGDDKPDLVVAEFGYDRGRVLWLENKGGGRFRDHELYAEPGAIHVPVVDLDGDGKPDVVTVVAQEDEEVVAFENLGAGKFRRRSLFAQANFDFGSSGLFVADLNGDGRNDLLLTGGDNLEITYNSPQPWHGCILLENQGGWRFVPRRIATVPGVYAAGVGDLNGDGHPDVVLVSMFNDWRQKGSASVTWLENDGKGNFTPWQVADAPSHLATVAVGDLDGDGRADIVAGSLHVLGPFDRLGRVTLWTSGPGGRR
jgi:FG-GAP-like repeat